MKNFAHVQRWRDFGKRPGAKRPRKSWPRRWELRAGMGGGVAEEPEERLNDKGRGTKRDSSRSFRTTGVKRSSSGAEARCCGGGLCRR
jgi:hypothetical protein